MSSRFFRAISDSESESSSEEEELLSDEEEQAQQKPKGGKKPADSDDESEESDEESSEEEESNEESDEGEAQPARKPMSRFMRDADSESESEEETPKIIKSAKDKRLDEFEAVVRNIGNAERIEDWVTISKGAWRAPRVCTDPRRLRRSSAPV